MELAQYLSIARRYWRSITGTFFLAVIVAALFTLVQTPSYDATSSVFVTVESGGTAGELSQGATYAERQVRSFVSVTTSSLVLQPVIDELGLDSTPQQLAQKLSVVAPASTSIIRITATDPSPEGAANLSNAVAASLQSVTGSLAPPGPDGNQLVSTTVIDPAVIPSAPASPRPLLNLALGALVGLLLGVGQAILRSVLDVRVRSVEDLAKVTDAPVLAAIGNNASHGADRADASSGVQWASAEAYRKLRTNVGFVGLGGERRPSMVVTSSVAGEGKTETATNLARVLALAGERVLLVDADLRRPQVAARLRLDAQLGLPDVLTGRGSFGELVIEMAPEGLSVLPAGTVPPNPSELLGSDAMGHLVAMVERQYDYVIFDAPPLLPVTDAVVLGAQTGGAIVVSRAGIIKKPQLDDALEILSTADVTLLGLVLNDVQTARANSYSGYYTSIRHDDNG